jgi:hypothetical protein
MQKSQPFGWLFLFANLPILIPMSVQDETKARRISGCWRGSPRSRADRVCSDSSEAHIGSDLQQASNEASSLGDQRISLILNAHWN